MKRKKYYVSIKTREISQTKVGDNDDFIVYATDGEVKALRNKLSHIEDAELGTYWRAHIPIVPYHIDGDNVAYDENLKDAFKMVYHLGDEKTKEFISSSGMLESNVNASENK